MKDYKQLVMNRVDETLKDLCDLSDTIWKNPEYNYKEFIACENTANLLKKYGFAVETGVGGIETALKATYDSGKPGPHIGFFGEYDAVPGMGHSCGHNLMAAMAVGAGEGLKSVIDDLGGKVSVYGTPAEEGGGGKIVMLQNGVFKDLSLAMILHSADETVVNDISYSRTDLYVNFYGKKSHAATWPEEGISALHPIIELFNLIASMRLELADRGKILGVITKGGEDPIYIPDHCQAKFTVRSFSMKFKLELLQRLLDTCEYLAKITGTRFTYEMSGLPYEDIRNNEVLEDLLHQNFTALGEDVRPREKDLGVGCTDMGNVTHELPALQSYVLVVPDMRGHTPEFEAACGSKAGHKAIAVGAKAMAMTAVDVLTTKGKYDEIYAAFKAMKAKYE